MIYVFSNDLTFSENIKEAVGQGGAELFNDETNLASALNAKEPDGILFDFHTGMRATKLLEKIYFERPGIMILLLIPGTGISEEIICDKELYWPIEASEIVKSFEETQKDRDIIKSCDLIGRSKELAAAAKTVTQVAPSEISVLLTGPSGAGKELIARAIHNKSSRPTGPFIPVNVAALAPGIIESELFGHEKGSFTGAHGRRLGVFEQASGGTIFLDEIGEIPPEIQAKLLRVLENRNFTRVGGNTSIAANFRLIAATNRILSDDIATGRFREDLYYRLSVVSIDLPSLQQRKPDIAPLTFYFLKRRSAELGINELTIEPGALRLFHRYEWPGNVRELRNVIDSFSVTSQAGRIKAADFEKYIRERTPRSHLLPMVTGRTPQAAEHQVMMQAILALTNEVSSLRNLIERELENIRFANSNYQNNESERFDSVNIESAEKELISKALIDSDGNRKKAARLLGIGERTLYRKIEKYGLK